jgi:hypothetical protein
VASTFASIESCWETTAVSASVAILPNTSPRGRAVLHGPSFHSQESSAAGRKPPCIPVDVDSIRGPGQEWQVIIPEILQRRKSGQMAPTLTLLSVSPPAISPGALSARSSMHKGQDTTARDSTLQLTSRVQVYD